MSSLCLVTLSLLCADPSKTAQEVKQDAAATVDASKRYAKEKKDEFVARMHARLEAAKQDADTLKRDAKDKSAAAAAELDARRKRASEKLDELGKASAEAWGSLKQGVENAVDDVERGVRRAKEK